MRKECETCIHLPVCKDELKNNETELCPYYEIEKPEEDHISKCQMQTRVSLPSDDQINFVAGVVASMLGFYVEGKLRAGRKEMMKNIGWFLAILVSIFIILPIMVIGWMFYGIYHGIAVYCWNVRNSEIGQWSLDIKNIVNSPL